MTQNTRTQITETEKQTLTLKHKNQEEEKERKKQSPAARWASSSRPAVPPTSLPTFLQPSHAPAPPHAESPALIQHDARQNLENTLAISTSRQGVQRARGFLAEIAQSCSVGYAVAACSMRIWRLTKGWAPMWSRRCRVGGHRRAGPGATRWAPWHSCVRSQSRQQHTVSTAG
eukprot:2312614-Rhodomonas_salina.12